MSVVPGQLGRKASVGQSSFFSLRIDANDLVNKIVTPHSDNININANIGQEDTAIEENNVNSAMEIPKIFKMTILKCKQGLGKM